MAKATPLPHHVEMISSGRQLSSSLSFLEPTILVGHPHVMLRVLNSNWTDDDNMDTFL